MKLLLIDSNIVFSAILNPESRIGEILLNSQETFEFCSVELLQEEINRLTDKFLEYGLGLEQVEVTKEEVYELINFYSEEIISFEVWLKAIRLVRDTDMDDVAFVALSLYFDAPIWTGDKKLIKGLREKGYDKCLTTDEVYDLKNIIESSNF